jgi:arylsulfatase A-like enzyme
MPDCNYLRFARTHLLNHFVGMKVATTFLSLLCLATFDAVATPDKPNIMVFLVDDMGVMDTSVPFLTDESGQPKRYPLNDYYRTPSMERLAGRGVRFNQFYAMSVCSPTRISIMTGQNAARHRTTFWIDPWQNNAGLQGPPEWNWTGLKKDDVTLPGELRKHGYWTIHVGKAHLGPAKSEGADPANLGFDLNIAGASFGSPGSYYGEENYGRGTRRDKSAVPHLDAYHGTDTFLSEALTIEAKKAVADTVKSKKPFFLHFSHYAVHAPFQSDPRFADYYKDSNKPGNAQAFATLVEGMDKSLGDMLNQIEELGIAENTLILFLGDNGTDAPLGDQHIVACAAPLRGKKGSHYEGGMRTPFIAAWAKTDPTNPWQQRLPIAAGAIQGQVANVTDIFPTLLGLVDAAAPENHIVDGTPLDTLLAGRPDPSRPEQFLMHCPHGVHRSNYFTVWRDGDWKVIYHTLPGIETAGGHPQSDGQTYQLFNLAKDPFEQNDLSKSEPEELRRLIVGLIDQLKTHAALYPVDAAKNPLMPILP